MADLKLWMRVGQPLEPLLTHYERWFDAWEAGGVCGLVIGRLVFLPDLPDPGADGSTPAVTSWGEGRPEAVAAFVPDPAVYRRWEVAPPPAPAQEFPARRRRLEQVLAAARERGWAVYLFEAAAGAGPAPGAAGPLIVDDARQRAYLARLEDTLAQFPPAEGAILDGPEWGYEIDPQHRSYLFDDLPPSLVQAAAGRGYDYQRLVAARDRLLARLHALTSALVTTHSPGGLLGAWQLLDGTPDLAAWLQFRTETLTAFFRTVREAAQQWSQAWGRPVRLGIGPRSPCFAPLCGYHLDHLATIFDLLLPKLYVWHRGFDGLYGTVGRYVRTLCDWNAGLTERDAFAVVGALFGLYLPAPEASDAATAERLLDLELGFPPAFFAQIVAQEGRRALAAVGQDNERVVPWVDTGRRPHEGDPVSTGDLYRLLMAAAQAGLRRYLYHNHGHLTAAEWHVMSALSGTPWQPAANGKGYTPPDD